MLDSKKGYGVIIGRFQPMHIGHIKLIEHIISEGYIPAIIVGISSDKHKNPILARDNLNYIQSLFTNAIVLPIEDHKDNIAWINNLDFILSSWRFDHRKSFTLFTHNKPSEAGKYRLKEGQFYSDLLLEHSSIIKNSVDLTPIFPNFIGKSATFTRALLKKALDIAPKSSIELLLKHM